MRWRVERVDKEVASCPSSVTAFSTATFNSSERGREGGRAGGREGERER